MATGLLSEGYYKTAEKLMHQGTSSRKIHLTWWQLVSIRENLIYLRTISLAISFWLTSLPFPKLRFNQREEEKATSLNLVRERTLKSAGRLFKRKGTVRKISHCCWSKSDFLTPYCILMKTLSHVPDFPFQLMDEEYCSIRRHTFFLPFSTSSCFIGCFISTTYNCFMMKAAFQLILKWNVLFHMGKAEEECLSQKRKSGICQWCKPDRKGREGNWLFTKGY